MRAILLGFFTLVLAVMLWVTTAASLDRSVLAAAADLWRDAWGRATLFDTYFAFLTVYLWIFCRERRAGARLAWLLAILALGNVASAAYFLWALWRAPGGDWRTLFPRREDLAR